MERDKCQKAGRHLTSMYIKLEFWGESEPILQLLKRSAASEARVISSERGVTSSARNAISSTN